MAATMSHAIQDAVKPCYLFKIPPELREVIYELVLPIKEIISTQRATSQARLFFTYDDDHIQVNEHFSNEKHSNRVPVLLQTCTLIRAEASPIYYSQNIFHVNASNMLDIAENWFRTRTAEDVALIKTVLYEKFAYRCRGTYVHERDSSDELLVALDFSAKETLIIRPNECGCYDYEEHAEERTEFAWDHFAGKKDKKLTADDIITTLRIIGGEDDDDDDDELEHEKETETGEKTGEKDEQAESEGTTRAQIEHEGAQEKRLCHRQTVLGTKSAWSRVMRQSSISR